jgi:glycerol kinase
VRDCAAEYGITVPALFGGAIPLRGIVGDQQAALIGQACFSPGMMKSTYGTGCFAILNTGNSAVNSRNRLLSTTAYRLGGETVYGLEGAIFIAGAAVHWLRDGLRIVPSAADTGPMIRNSIYPNVGGVLTTAGGLVFTAAGVLFTSNMKYAPHRSLGLHRRLGRPARCERKTGIAPFDRLVA